MKRVLFVFSKLNSGIRYVQGMNEVLAPLYYVFRTDTDESNPVSCVYLLDWEKISITFVLDLFIQANKSHIDPNCGFVSS
jgi:hypothetical protein